MSTPQIFRGACPHDCPDTCATITEVQDGKAIRFYADKQHPITQGWLCAKVRPYLERVYHPDRLTHPLRRIGPKGSGNWQRISWEEAIEEITSRWKQIIAEHGPAAILPYSYSGTLGLIQMIVASQRLWNRMGVSALDRAICGAAAETVVEATLGGRMAPDAADMVHSKFILIWGHNPASTNPHFMPFLRQAQKNGAYVVVIDPRRTLTARSADQHIRPHPATDGALALGMINIIFSENLHDEAWLEANSIGWRELRTRASEYPVERVAEITGIESEVIIELARRYATTKPALLKTADGVQRHGNGGQTFRALTSLPAIVGQIGVRGGGLFYSTSGYLRWDAEAMGYASQCPPAPRTINMNRLGAALLGEVEGPPIQSLFVFCANPVTSSPNAGKIVQGMQREDLFTVVHELFMTDTAQYADIVLPATSQLEHVDLHKPYGHRNLQYNHAAIAPLGESKSNWELMHLLAEGMGYQEAWLHETPEEAIQHIIESTRANATPAMSKLLTGVTLERLQAEGTVPLYFDEENTVPFENLRFPTPSGKVELYCKAMEDYGLDPLPHYEVPAEFVKLDRRKRKPHADDQLVLLTGAAHHYVTSSMANVPSLMAKEGTPYVEINPADAAIRGIEAGEDVLVENDRGWCQLRAVVTDDVPPGVLVAPKGAWARLSPGQHNINYTTSDALADLAGQSTFHSNLVELRRAVSESI
jgi:anaerobic selenocysteine-containing dehydrogenase